MSVSFRNTKFLDYTLAPTQTGCCNKIVCGVMVRWSSGLERWNGLPGNNRALVRIPAGSYFSFHLTDGGNRVGLSEAPSLYGRARLVARLITAKSI